MPEPKSKYGKGSKEGRPRQHDRDQVAIDLISWAQKDDSINLCKFCATYKPIIDPSKLTNWAKEDEYFRQALACAKVCLGARREELLNKDMIHMKAYDLNAATYDYFLKQEKRENQDYESSLKNQEIAQYSDSQMNTAQLLIKQMQERQSLSSKQDANASIVANNET